MYPVLLKNYRVYYIALLNMQLDFIKIVKHSVALNDGWKTELMSRA